MGFKEYVGRSHGLRNLLLAGGLFFMGYCSNNLMTSTSEHLKKAQEGIKEDPAAYISEIEGMISTGYSSWVEGQRQRGINVDQVSGIEPKLKVGSDNVAHMSISEVASGSTTGQGTTSQEYTVRRLSGELSDKLGTKWACGNDEQVINQFASVVSTTPAVWENYPAKNKDVIKDYVSIQVGNVVTNTYNTIRQGMYSIFEGVMGWFK